MKSCPSIFRLLLGVLLLASASALSAQTNSTPPAKPDDALAQETLRAYLQVQEQLHVTQMAIEQNRKDAEEQRVKTDEQRARTAEALAARLQAIEAALGSQRARELEAMQSSNRVMLFMAGTFAVVGFAAMLLMAYFQWRTVHGLAEISAALPGGRAALGSGLPLPALPAPNELPGAAIEQSNARLLGTLEKLEHRLFALEHTSRPALEQGTATPRDSAEAIASSNGNGSTETASTGGPIPQTAPVAHETASSSSSNGLPLQELLSEGQKQLDADQPESALAKFEQALELSPANAEALVKKGVALERLQKPDDAIACYDAAIQADSAFTIAYLHKGGLYNRMEKFGDALECYEKALRTQERRGI